MIQWAENISASYSLMQVSCKFTNIYWFDWFCNHLWRFKKIEYSLRFDFKLVSAIVDEIVHLFRSVFGRIYLFYFFKWNTPQIFDWIVNLHVDRLPKSNHLNLFSRWFLSNQIRITVDIITNGRNLQTWLEAWNQSHSMKTKEFIHLKLT